MPHIPVHPSAEKRHRQNLKRREHNRAARTQVRTAVKTASEAIAATDAAAAQEKLRAAISALDKAMQSASESAQKVFATGIGAAAAGTPIQEFTAISQALLEFAFERSIVGHRAPRKTACQRIHLCLT